MEFMGGRRFVVAGGATDMPWKGLGLLANEDGHRNLMPLLQIPSCATSPCEVPHDGNLKLSAWIESQCEQALMEDCHNNLPNTSPFENFLPPIHLCFIFSSCPCYIILAALSASPMRSLWKTGMC